MLDFLNQDAVSIILSAEVIFSAVFTLSMFVLVHALLSYLRHSGPLYTRMTEIEAQLFVLQASIPVKLEKLSEIRRSLQPLEDDFKQMRAYHARLNYMERKAIEKEAMEAEENRIDRGRKGLDRFI